MNTPDQPSAPSPLPATSGANRGELDDYQKAVLSIAMFDLAYHSLKSAAQSVIVSGRPFGKSGEQTAVLVDALIKLTEVVNRPDPKWPEKSAAPDTKGGEPLPNSEHQLSDLWVKYLGTTEVGNVEITDGIRMIERELVKWRNEAEIQRNHVAEYSAELKTVTAARDAMIERLGEAIESQNKEAIKHGEMLADKERLLVNVESENASLRHAPSQPAPRLAGGELAPEIAALCEFARCCLQSSKEAVADGSTSEEDEATLELAQRLGVGNVRRVPYDPAVHGADLEAEPGDTIWYWGAPPSPPPSSRPT